MTDSIEPTLQVTNLNFKYGNLLVLKGLSIEVSKGETVGILGPNGSGKSTLLRLITGAMPPLEKSQIKVNGRYVAELKAKERARLVAFVPQSEDHFFDFTVRDLVLMGRFPHSDGLFETKEDRAIAAQAMESTDCLEFADRRISTLSGGEAQRVLIARALAQQAPLLICDEPTTHLDTIHQLGVTKTLSHHKTLGQTTIVTTHDFNLANHICDKVFILNAGKIVFSGNLMDAARDGTLARVFGTEFQIFENNLVLKYES